MQHATVLLVVADYKKNVNSKAAVVHSSRRLDWLTGHAGTQVPSRVT